MPRSFPSARARLGWAAAAHVCLTPLAGNAWAHAAVELASSTTPPARTEVVGEPAVPGAAADPTTGPDLAAPSNSPSSDDTGLGGPGEAGEEDDKDEVASEDPRDDTNSQRSGTALSGREPAQDDVLPPRVELVGKQKKTPKNLSHARTAAVSAGFGMGYGLVTAGDKYCGEFSAGSGDADGRKSLCTGATPPALEFAVAFGAHARVDVTLGVRFNLTPREYDASPCEGGSEVCVDGKGLFLTQRGFGILPGVRLWGADNGHVVKIGGGVDVFYMREDFGGYRERQSPLEEKADNENKAAESAVGDSALGLRGGPVIQVDPHHNFGVYLMPAAVTTFRPSRADGGQSGWFEIAFEATIGVQARFP
ncbi:MAG: hypothetical protein V3V08_15640 [Nannocystaceae bacterium]